MSVCVQLCMQEPAYSKLELNRLSFRFWLFSANALLERSTGLDTAWFGHIECDTNIDGRQKLQLLIHTS